MPFPPFQILPYFFTSNLLSIYLDTWQIQCKKIKTTLELASRESIKHFDVRRMRSREADLDVMCIYKFGAFKKKTIVLSFLVMFHAIRKYTTP